MTDTEQTKTGAGKARRAVSPRGADARRRGGAEGPQMERLQKVLAARGVASRRAAEELILEGRVTVDGRVVTELGTKVDPASASIKVGGRLLKAPRLTYLLLNKPRGYITTASDPEGRRTVYDLLDPSATRERVYPVGRLDMDSEGLLLLTNDGELANRIAHPRYRIDKEYNALVAGTPTPGALARAARGGQMIDGGWTSPSEVTILGSEGGETWLRVVIHEGRKHQIRRMMEGIGHPVRRLRRVRLGPLSLAGLPAATYRPLGGEELSRLRRMLGLAGEEGATPEAPAERRAAPRPARTPTRTIGGAAGSVRPGAVPGNRAARQPDRATGNLPGGGRGRDANRAGRADERPTERRGRGGPNVGGQNAGGSKEQGRGKPRQEKRSGGKGRTGGGRGRQPGGNDGRRP